MEKNLNREKGILSDCITDIEMSFTKQAAQLLSEIDWAKELLTSNKIVRALAFNPDPNRSYDELSEIKSALFEARFAYTIYKAGLTAKYEFPSNIGNSTVDFKILANSNEWLIELTSLRESIGVKENTRVEGNYFEFISRTKFNFENSPEVRDILKIQSAICCKVSDSNNYNEQGNPIKFPEIKKNSYHAIIVDVRSFGGTGGDCWDWFNVSYGSKKLMNFKHGIYCIHFKDRNGNNSLINGLFEEDHPDKRSEYIRKRIHVIGFVSEKEYKEGEIIDKIHLCPNPNFFNDEKEFLKIFPIKIHKN